MLWPDNYCYIYALIVPGTLPRFRQIKLSGCDLSKFQTINDLTDMKKIFLISACLGLALGGFAQEYDDDIYYNPKTAKTKTTKADKKTVPTGATVIGGDTQTYYYYPQSAYQETRDVDEYNRHGGYYQTPIDTIGQGMANSQDFVYTQEIQKYYNPTIVVDNLAVLSDVLDNSYGNVNIVYDYGYPTFTPWYSWSSPWYRTTWCWDPYWNWCWGPSWAWGYAPGWSWSWGWGGWYDPWYAWGPSWGWGWGPGWGWGDTWRPSTPRPGNNLNPGWANNTRPGTGSHRQPGVVTGQGGHMGTRPGMSVSGNTSRPGTGNGGYNGHRQPNVAGGQYQGTATRPSTSLDATNHRPATGTAATRPGMTTRPNAGLTARPNSGLTARPSTGNVSNMGVNQGTYSRPGTSTTTTRPSTQTTRPSGNMTTTRPNTTTRSSGYNPGSSRGAGSSGGFRSGGTRGMGGGMGGGMRGGGGGGGHRR